MHLRRLVWLVDLRLARLVDHVDLATQVDQILERAVVQFLGDSLPLLLLAEDDVGGEGLDQLALSSLLGHVLEHHLHPAIVPDVGRGVWHSVGTGWGVRRTGFRRVASVTVSVASLNVRAGVVLLPR